MDSTPQTYTVEALLPGYDGPFILEVPAISSEAASRRAMFTMMAADLYDPPPGVLPDEAMRLFRVTGSVDTASVER